MIFINFHDFYEYSGIVMIFMKIYDFYELLWFLWFEVEFEVCSVDVRWEKKQSRIIHVLGSSNLESYVSLLLIMEQKEKFLNKKLHLPKKWVAQFA